MTVKSWVKLCVMHTENNLPEGYHWHSIWVPTCRAFQQLIYLTAEHIQLAKATDGLESPASKVVHAPQVLNACFDCQSKATAMTNHISTAMSN